MVGGISGNLSWQLEFAKLSKYFIFIKSQKHTCNIQNQKNNKRKAKETHNSGINIWKK